jgi:hypothetical protein
MWQLWLRTWWLCEIGRADTDIGAEGARALAGALPQMASLTKLSLDGTSGEGVVGDALGLCEGG